MFATGMGLNQVFEQMNKHQRNILAYLVFHCPTTCKYKYSMHCVVYAKCCAVKIWDPAKIAIVFVYTHCLYWKIGGGGRIRMLQRALDSKCKGFQRTFAFKLMYYIIIEQLIRYLNTGIKTFL